MREAVKVLDDFAYDLIQQREKEGLANLTAADKTGRASNDLLSLYLAIRDENGQPLSKKALRCGLSRSTCSPLRIDFDKLIKTVAVMRFST